MPPPHFVCAEIHDSANMSQRRHSSKNILASQKASMKIEHKPARTNGFFYVEKDGMQVAKLVYRLRDDDTMVIEHTEVDDALRGKNIGAEMVKAAVDYARQKKMHIIPQCSFTHSVFVETKAYNDVWAKP